MDLTSAFDFVQKYAREYVYYVFSFLKARRPGEEDTYLSLSDGQLIRFAFISTVIGILFEGLFVKQTALPKIDFLPTIIIQISYWTFLSIFTHIGLSFGNNAVQFSDSTASIFRIFPICYAVGAYSAFIFYYGGLAIYKPAAPTAAGIADAAVSWSLVAGHFGKALSRIGGAPIWRRRAVYAFVLLLTLLVELVSLLVHPAPPETNNAEVISTRIVRATAADGTNYEQ
jgi:hypothetical protein